MRALLSAVGTRGDVQPVLALATALRARGHAVRLCISPNFVAWASRLGFDPVPMGVEMRVPRSGSATAALSPEDLRRLRESMPDLITDQFDTIGAAADGCDVIVGGNAHQYAAPSIAEHLGIACVTAVYAPVAIPSADLAPPAAGISSPERDASAERIALEWRNTRKAWNDRALDRVNQNRRRVGLGPIDDVLDYALTDRTWLAADAVLAPAPYTPGRTVFQTGTWVLAGGSPLPADVEAFLDRGEPPMFVSFGSMPAAPDLARWWIRAARAAGRRVVLGRGWADLAVIDDAEDCIAVGDLSYDVLFPRVAAVVHHGGAGTTATAARAGVPQIIAPMFGDQFYWASRIVELGAGVTVSQTTATEDSLAGAVATVCGRSIVARARSLATRVTSDGADVAANRLDADYS